METVVKPVRKRTIEIVRLDVVRVIIPVQSQRERFVVDVETEKSVFGRLVGYFVAVEKERKVSEQLIVALF